MGARDAAESLQSRLERNDWLTGVGVGSLNGQPVLYVYLKYPIKNDETESLRVNGWMGFPVIVDRVGSIRPATA
jgi:hypothetical protein